METDYKLRSDVLWHDGAPFTAEDIAFSLQVNKDPRSAEWKPGRGAACGVLAGHRSEHDRGDVAGVVAWPDRMEHRDLFTLPKHLLEQPYTTGSKESFLALPYWNAEYVGVGPFRVNR